MKRKRSGECSQGKKAKMSAAKVASWNVNGLRAALRKGSLQGFLSQHQPNICCLQETKLQRTHVQEVCRDIEGRYFSYWNCCEEKKGFAGVALLSDRKPVKVTYDLEELEEGKEGRVLTAEFPDWFLVTIYFPQPGNNFSKLPEKLAWEQRFKTMIASLQRQKPVVCLGDFNIILSDKDCPPSHIPRLYNYFDKAEIDSFRSTVTDLGLVDTFRHFHPEQIAYTYYSARNKKPLDLAKGWRLDYIFASQPILASFESSEVVADAGGSDHFPVIAEIKHR